MKTNTVGKETGKNHAALIKGYCLGASFGLIGSILLLFVCACVLFFGEMGEGAGGAFVFVCTAFGGLLTGYFATRRAGQKGLLHGALSGGFYFLALCVLGLLLGGLAAELNTFVQGALSVLFGGVGGIIAVNRPK